MTKEEYNNVPVYYCKDCGSLHVLNPDRESEKENERLLHCGDCGGVRFTKCTIDKWLEKYGKHR